MRCRAYIVALLWSALAPLKAQNFSTREHGFLSPLVYNPAAAGSEGRLTAVLSSRRTWYGIKDGPATHLLNIHGRAADLRLDKPKKYISGAIDRMAFGLGVYSDRNGPLRVNAVQLALAHRIPLGEKTTLSAGFSLKAHQYSLAENLFSPTDPGDPQLSQARQNTVIPHVNAGLYLRGKKYFAGIASTNLAGLGLNPGDFYRIDNLRTCYLNGGYRIFRGSAVVLQPEVLLRYYDGRLWFDGLVKWSADEHLWLAGGYSTVGFISGYFAFRSQKMNFGYMYEFSPSGIYRLSRGNHMLFIGYNLF